MDHYLQRICVLEILPMEVLILARGTVEVCENKSYWNTYLKWLIHSDSRTFDLAWPKHTGGEIGRSGVMGCRWAQISKQVIKISLTSIEKSIWKDAEGLDVQECMSTFQRFWIGYTTLQDFLHVKVLKTTIVLTITNLLAFEELIDLHYVDFFQKDFRIVGLSCLSFQQK